MTLDSPIPTGQVWTFVTKLCLSTTESGEYLRACAGVEDVPVRTPDVILVSPLVWLCRNLVGRVPDVIVENPIALLVFGWKIVSNLVSAFDEGNDLISKIDKAVCIC